MAVDAWEGDVTSRISVTSDVDTSRAGTYTVRYNVADSSGNSAAEAVRTVRVPAQEPDDSDHNAPTVPTIQTSEAGWTSGPVAFTLSGSTDLDSGVQKYQYKLGIGGDWVDYAGSAVMVDAEGETEVYARALDNAGNVSPEASAVVRIYRGVPSLTLLGETRMVVEAGSIYEEPGFVASDVRDGNIDSRVVVTGTVDPSRLGTYEMHYSVTNAVGMSATAVRTVVVRDTVAPILTVLGDNPAVVPIDAAYVDGGVMAVDAWEGDVTSRLSVTSDVDTNRAGTYTVRYNVTDSSGNAAAEAVRTVRVVKSGATPETPAETPPETPPGTPPDSAESGAEAPSAPLTPPAMSTVIRIPAESGATVQGELNGLLEIRIPSGALQRGTEVRMEVSSASPAPTSGTLTSEMFNVASSTGTELTEPMIVRIRYASEQVPAGQQPALYYYNEQQKRWIYVGGEITEAGTLQAEMNHFSPIAVIAGPPVGFEDTAGHWAEKATKRLAGMQVVSGMEEGVYLPGVAVTRAQFVVMLSRTFNLASEPPATFKDGEHIPAWAESHIAAAAQKGWIQGYAAGDALAFMPDQGMTRAELAVLVARILDTYEQATPANSADKGYADQAAIPGWADFAVHRMAALHLMQGYEDGKFHPERSVTRAEAAVVLYRLLEWLHM
ncbi:immunoglobulin-like domain-containing protein [Paenibacillus whitsoniae]